MKGICRLTNNDLAKPFEQKTALYKTGIAVGDYPIDHHHHKNNLAPPIKFIPIPSYSIPLGCLIPVKTDGLIAAEKNISVSNIVNGTTRLQPVVLLTGQAAGALAAYCVLKNIQPRKANVREVQHILLKAKCYLMPYVDVQPDDIYWEAIQKAGATGILKGTGKSEGWANKMYFFPDSLIMYETFKSSINNFIPCLQITDTVIVRPLQVKEAWDMLVILLHKIRIKKGIPHPWPPVIYNKQMKVWSENLKQDYPGHNKPITRKQLAVFINALAQNPFNVAINLNGEISN